MSIVGKTNNPNSAPLTCVSLMVTAIFLVACADTEKKSQSNQNGYDNRARETIAHAQQDEALYQDRFVRLGEVFSKGKKFTSVYDSLIGVEGVESPVDLPIAAAPILSDTVRTAAIDYAEKMNSSVFIVMKAGEIVLEEYFGEDNAKTLLNSKSLAKPLGVISVGRAIKLGHIKSLDQPVSDFITEWVGTPKEEITVRHLLGMRSGLQHQINDPSPEHVINRAYLHPRHDEIIINEYPLINKPGARYDYSNANAELVAPLIERATGVRYNEWVSNEVIQKIGAPGGEIWLNREGGVAHAGCCVLLPAQTYARLGLLVLQNGNWQGNQLLPTNYVAEMRKAAPDNENVGLGLYLGQPFKEKRGYQNPDLDLFPVYHSAPYKFDDLVLFDGNSNQVAYLSEKNEVLILRMGNTPPRERPWDNAFLPNILFDDLVN